MTHRAWEPAPACSPRFVRQLFPGTGLALVKVNRIYNYGRCHICVGKMQAKRIQQDFWIRKRLIVIEAEPAGVCVQCGEKIVSADVGRSLAGALKDTTRRRKARTIAVPVIRFAKYVA